MMELRDYIEGDEKQILELFKVVFKKEMSFDYWHWRFIKNPLKKIQIKLMFDSNNTLIGHYAVSPQVLYVNGEKKQAALSMTTMTHPDHAGKGIFTKLASELYNNYSEAQELSVVYGFPNANSYYGFIHKLGWKDVCLIPTLSNEEFKVREHSCKVIGQFNNRHEEMYDSSIKAYDVYLGRSAAWFNWRYFENPANEYIAYELNGSGFIVGKLFTSENVNEIDICELACESNKEILVELISALYAHFSNIVINKINLWMPPNDKRYEMLLETGFKAGEPATHLGCALLEKGLSDNFNTFFYSKGDSDIY